MLLSLSTMVHCLLMYAVLDVLFYVPPFMICFIRLAKILQFKFRLQEPGYPPSPMKPNIIPAILRQMLNQSISDCATVAQQLLLMDYVLISLIADCNREIPSQ